MKKRTSVVIALATAAITFGSLMTFAGDKKFGMHKHRQHCEGRLNYDNQQPANSTTTAPNR